MTNHSFHDFHTSFERNRVSSSLGSLLLLSFFIMMMLFIFFFLIFFLFPFKFINITVPNFPLGNLSSKIISNWWFCGSSSLFNIWINGLNFSSFVIEFVSHCLFDGFYIFTWSRFFLFCLSSKLLEVLFSVKLNLFLNFVFIMSCMNIITFKTEMSNHLVDTIIDFIFSFIVVIHNFVWRSLRIGHD